MTVDFVRLVPFFVPAVQTAVLYIGINALITLILALNVSRTRVKAGVYFGEGTDPSLQRAIRAHGNNVEYVPITLLTIVGVAVLGAPLWFIHLLGIALSLGRVLHGIGLVISSGSSFGRGVGALLTWFALLAGGIGALIYALAALPTLAPATM